MKVSGKTRKRMGLAAGACLLSTTMVGCGGGNGGGPIGPPPPAANLLALISGSRLLSFNSTTAQNTTIRQVTGLGAGETLAAIDFRFAPQGGGATGLYGLTRNGANSRLYRLDITGNGNVVATPISAAITPPALDTVSLDFNPVVDRLRVVAANGTNLRVNPDTGQVVDADLVTPGTQTDTNLAFAAGDANFGATPRAVAVAYTNNDSDAATGTINYALDVNRDILVTQGRPDDPLTPANEAVSPNTGQLFTVGNLGVNFSDAVGFDIANANTAFLLGVPVGDSRAILYTLNLTTGAATASQNLSFAAPILDIAVVP